MSAAQSRVGTANKENVPPTDDASREDVTALPMQQRLERSPHLRAIDILEKPQIPYNFRPHSTSQTSVQRHDAIAKLSKSNTLRSKRSTTEYSSPTRRFSTRSKKRDPVREEEIRSMTTPIPIPKRPGDGPLRRDSKKIRGPNGDSHVSLPPEGSIHSTMSGVMEQRGWEVGSIAAVFKARPAVRLSGLPQYVSNSMPPSSSGILYRIDASGSPTDDRPIGNSNMDAKERRKRRIVGKDADELGASDIRAIMEREAHRKEKRQLERQERLDRKLRSAGRDRADSERKRRNSDERRRAEATRARVEQELQARGVLTPPSEVHPALRDNATTKPEVVGLGIGESETPAQPPDVEQPQISAVSETSANPFSDAAETSTAELMEVRDARDVQPSTPQEHPYEEPHVGTAQAVRMSMTSTPPLSPIHANRAASSVSHLADIARFESASQPSIDDLQPPPRLPVERRNSADPPYQKQQRSPVTWATFFRRGGTFRRSSQGPPTSEAGSFSNTSRESMRNQAIPAHLVGTDHPRPPTTRSRSGTPVRTQSRFREDLPEMPISPPDSRTQSPDVTAAAAAAAAAAARRSARTTPMNIPGKTRDGEGDVYTSYRNDTPLSAVSRGHVPMSASLASIDSEGSWLAGSSSKRQSHQSALSRSYSKRNAEFFGSYEELGGDRDAEYLSRNKSPGPASRGNIMGASPDEESEEESSLGATPGEPSLTVHGSVRRRPTLVQHDARLVSREGLVQEYAAQGAPVEPIETPREHTPDDEDVPEFHTPEQSDDEYHELESSKFQRAVELGRARSVDMKQHARHSRRFSAGSARLLDMPARHGSVDATRETTPEPNSTR